VHPFKIRGVNSKLAATAKTLTADGWLKSGDIGYLDHEGFLYIRDRSKKLDERRFIVLLTRSSSQRPHHPRGREHCASYCFAVQEILKSHYDLQDSTSLENAVSADSRLLEVAAVGVPDSRLGELPTVVAYAKPEFAGKVTEAEVIKIASKRYVTVEFVAFDYISCFPA
jgi:acyl-CoA synthetase (AMP-forming)/AMP-acid ligase II